MTHNDDNCIFVIYSTNCITDKNFSPLCLAIQEILKVSNMGDITFSRNSVEG